MSREGEEAVESRAEDETSASEVGQNTPLLLLLFSYHCWCMRVVIGACVLLLVHGVVACLVACCCCSFYMLLLHVPVVVGVGGSGTC